MPTTEEVEMVSVEYVRASCVGAETGHWSLHAECTNESGFMRYTAAAELALLVMGTPTKDSEDTLALDTTWAVETGVAAGSPAEECPL